jgi:predicted 3-demethylubiquinone-9 3-methyltransferase (glyoxalase superfamily)
MTASRIATCLWFDKEAEEAARYYVSVLKDARLGAISRYGKDGPMPEGLALTVEFEIGGQRFLGLNGGPTYRLSEAVSIVVECETQAEIDDLWKRLTDGGAESRCGWLKDRYGLSWQIIPTRLRQLMSRGEPRRTSAMFQALLQMSKLDITRLQAAYDSA